MWINISILLLSVGNLALCATLRLQRRSISRLNARLQDLGQSSADQFHAVNRTLLWQAQDTQRLSQRHDELEAEVFAFRPAPKAVVRPSEFPREDAILGLLPRDDN